MNQYGLLISSQILGASELLFTIGRQYPTAKTGRWIKKLGPNGVIAVPGAISVAFGLGELDKQTVLIMRELLSKPFLAPKIRLHLIRSSLSTSR